MRAGMLRHRVEIYSISIAPDATGAPTNSETLFNTLWARVNVSGGQERWTDASVINEYDAVITIRYRTDLTDSMRVKYDGNTYEIKSIIDPYGNKVDLKLMCKRYG